MAVNCGVCVNSVLLPAEWQRPARAPVCTRTPGMFTPPSPHLSTRRRNGKAAAVSPVGPSSERKRKALFVPLALRMRVAAQHERAATAACALCSEGADSDLGGALLQYEYEGMSTAAGHAWLSVHDLCVRASPVGIGSAKVQFLAPAAPPIDKAGASRRGRGVGGGRHKCAAST